METDEGKNKWAIYLTNWGLTVCTIQSFLSSLMLFCVVLGTSAFEAPQLVSSILKAYKAYWIANVIATTVAFTISFVYWTLIHKGKKLKRIYWCSGKIDSVFSWILVHHEFYGARNELYLDVYRFLCCGSSSSFVAFCLSDLFYFGVPDDDGDILCLWRNC